MMTTTPREWVLAIVVGALLIPALVGWVLGPAGRRDRVLFGGAILVATFAIAGAGAMSTSRGAHGAELFVALLMAFALRGRWRAARSERSLTDRGR